MGQEKEARTIIKPRLLKGFRDSLPDAEIPKKAIIGRLEQLFSSYGFVPIDTPALEYTEVLLGKGGGETDKQIFHFEDNGGRDVAMRFDLTVPFARFLALNRNSLPMPFKRYHVNKVWRGENPQKGRYREFIQCDFDIVGLDNAEADFEILSVMHASFALMGVEHYRFHLAHRGIFNQMLAHLQIAEHNSEILRIVDKLRKIGRLAVLEQLQALLGDSTKAQAILRYIEKEREDEPFLTTLARLEELGGGESEHSRRMRTIHAYLVEAQIDEHYILDPSITRGLDYYTGLVYETFLVDLPHYGSVCSGGRYNDLASLYTKEHLPGVGSSIGLDRLMSALTELGSPIAQSGSSADVAILNTPSSPFAERDRAARTLRKANIAVSVYLDERKIGAQYKWAESQAIRFVLTDGQRDRFTLKDLQSKEVWEAVSADEAAAIITKELH
ncbi:MAG: histidine--tRNA ligase [Sphaerochaeta sp.]|jgi:histidyl-tRNA synthetase|nr:histidine--tRNA ligase [Spirochaetales bacterium]